MSGIPMRYPDALPGTLSDALPCANHRHARVALVTLEGHCLWLTPMFRGRVSHSDSGLNTVGGVLACPWFVNDWHSCG